MTENEIKEFVADTRRKAEIFRNSGFATAGFVTHFDKSADIIEELSPYMAIGTVDEFKALKEKSVAKKPDFTEDKQFALCPNISCNSKGLKDKQQYCDCCGQKLDWQ